MKKKPNLTPEITPKQVTTLSTALFAKLPSTVAQSAKGNILKTTKIFVKRFSKEIGIWQPKPKKFWMRMDTMLT